MEILFQDMPNIAYAVDRLNNDGDIVINKCLKYAPDGLLKAIKEHEKVHIETISRGGEYFLFDGKYSWKELRDEFPSVLRKHGLKELEKILEVCGYNSHQACYDCFQVHGFSCDVARYASKKIRSMVNLIAYHESEDNEAKMWISLLEYVRHDLHQIINHMRIKDLKIRRTL